MWATRRGPHLPLGPLNKMTSQPPAANLACMIHPIPCTIGDLLTQPYIFEIPRYQRDYSWQREEVGELINDLIGPITPCILAR